jgi:hypothetical protein
MDISEDPIHRRPTKVLIKVHSLAQMQQNNDDSYE